MKGKKSEEAIERRITRGMIHSNEYLQQIRPNWKKVYIVSSPLSLIVDWCIEYYDKYEKVPGRTIEDIYFDKKDAKEIPHDLIESVELILEDLSGEQDDINVPYLLDSTHEYEQERHLEMHQDALWRFFDKGEITKAVELAESFTGVNGTAKKGLAKVICTSTDFIKRKIQAPTMLLHPWLTEQSLNLLYGPRGAGKTWLCNILAVALTRMEAYNTDAIGPWYVKNGTGVLFVDGEMNNHMLQDRIKELARPLPNEDPENPLLILSGHDYSNTNDTQLNLDKVTRRTIYDILRDRKDIQIVILDNISALFPGLDENSKQDWDEINQWLISLRHLGKTVILVHHASKEGKQRGTSGREDAMDTIINVDQHKDLGHEDNAWFTISFKKSRNLKPGASKRDFSIRIVDHPDGGLTWEQDESGEISAKKQDIILDILCEKGTMQEIGNRHDVKKQYVHKLKTGICVNKGWVVKNKNGKFEITDKGLEYVEEYG